MSAAAVPNHRRTKPGGIKPGAATNGVVGPTSQIPGLSQAADEKAPAERISGRRVGIFESDSDYVKLAKSGGQKGLLSHDVDDEANGKKSTYKAPEWFSADSKSGSEATTPDGKSKARPLTAPFGTDSSSSWERETDLIAKGKVKISPSSAANQLEGLTIVEANKYKRTSFEKKAPPVSMSKLLSFGYMEEKTSPDDDDASSVTTEPTSTIATEDVDDLE